VEPESIPPPVPTTPPPTEEELKEEMLQKASDEPSDAQDQPVSTEEIKPEISKPVAHVAPTQINTEEKEPQPTEALAPTPVSLTAVQPTQPIQAKPAEPVEAPIKAVIAESAPENKGKPEPAQVYHRAQDSSSTSNKEKKKSPCTIL